MTDSFEGVIEDVIIQPDKIQPILVNFLNGQLRDEATEKMKCGLYLDEKNNKTVLAVSNDQMVYKGYRPDPTKELNYTMLAIRNKKTGKIRLVQAERWNVAPVLDRHINHNDDEEIDRMAALNKQFGSKKMKRRTEQYEKMKINPENVKDQLEETVKNVQINEADLEFDGKDEFIEGVMLPACNKNATVVSDVYNVYDIVPEEILQCLRLAVDKVIKSDPKEPLFFAETLEKLVNSGNHMHKIAILLYMQAISNWLNIPLKLAKKKESEICPYSSEVITHVIDSYSLPSAHGKLRPNSMRDKGIIHCLVLSLILWDFTLDLEKFSTMLKFKISIKKLIELARYVYAVPSKENNKCVVLKLPLPAPASKVMVKRKKRLNG